MLHPGRARRHLRLAAAAGLLAAAAGSGGMCTPSEPPPKPDDLMPAGAGDWTRDGDDGHYTFDTLYDLIDGGAEVYRSFGVVRAISRRYARPGSAGILADLFDMGDPAGAYGIYHHDVRDGPSAGLGDESERIGAAVAFRSDRYFVSVVALDELPGSADGSLAVARAIAARLPAGSPAPEVVRLLPEAGLLHARVVYMRDTAYLRTRYDFGSAPPPALPPGAEAVLARYRDAAGARVLMLIRYPTAAQAGAATETFRAGWLVGAPPAPAAGDVPVAGDASAAGEAPAARDVPAARATDTARRADGRWAGVTTADDILVAVLESENRPDMKAITTGILGRRQRTGATPDPERDPAPTGETP